MAQMAPQMAQSYRFTEKAAASRQSKFRMKQKCCLDIICTSSIHNVFEHPNSQASLAKMEGARSKVKVDLDSLVNYLLLPKS